MYSSSKKIYAWLVPICFVGLIPIETFVPWNQVDTNDWDDGSYHVTRNLGYSLVDKPPSLLPTSPKFIFEHRVEVDQGRLLSECIAWITLIGLAAYYLEKKALKARRRSEQMSYFSDQRRSLNSTG